MECFIGKKKILGEGKSKWEKFSPFDESPLFSVIEASEAQIETALIAAQQGFLSWSNLTSEQRSKKLLRLSELVEQNKNELARIESQETGRAIREIYAYDLPVTIEALRYYAQLICQLHELPLEQPSGLAAKLNYAPYGVCLGIGAWNYPLQIAAWKMAPALAAGNAMIFKPSEITPSSVVYLAELCLEAEIPVGVFQVLQGRESVAEYLIRSPEIRKVSLTGSVNTGKKVAALAGENLKPVTLELGGKSPLLILSDANPAEAAKIAVLANFYSTGQVCTNGTRVFLPRSLIKEVTENIISLTKQIKIGNPLDEETECGPLISQSQWNIVNTAVENGKKSGARLLCGGKRPAGYSNGYFIEPTVFSQVTDDMLLAREEIFGPVMSILAYDSEEELVRRANSLEYGLAAGIVTMNQEKAETLAHALDAGICWINTYNDTPLNLPFGGTKSSGIGRENGIAGLRQYQQSKSIITAKQKLPNVFTGFSSLS